MSTSKYATKQTTATSNNDARRDIHTSVMAALEAAQRGAHQLAARHIASARRDLKVNREAGHWTLKGANTMNEWLVKTEGRCEALKGQK
jgi:hypothetical protein